MVTTSSSVKPQESKTFSLGAWGQAILLLLIVIGIYLQTWIDIWPYWENKNATYTHGTLVAMVAVWLTWRARSTVNWIQPTPSVRALALVVVLSAVWLMAEKAGLFIVYTTLWPLLAFVTLWAGLGLSVAFRFAFPLSFLYFAIPIWDYLKPPLQVITSTMAQLLTSILGIPAAFDGPYATLPTGTIFIARDCGGAHFFSVALAVGVLAGVLRRDNLRTRILIVIVAGLLSMIFNWLRIVLIVLAYLHPSLKDGLETMGHLTFGWWVFALDLVVFSLVLRYVPRSDSHHGERRTRRQTAADRRKNSFGLFVATIAAIVLPAIAWTLPRFDAYPSAIPNSDLHTFSTGSDLLSPDLRWRPYYPGAAWEERFAILLDGGIAVEIYGNQYHSQAQGSELISRASYLFDPMTFSTNSSSVIYLQDSQNRSLLANRVILTDSAGNPWVAFYTYFVDNEPIVSGRRVQLLTALRSMYARTTAGVVAAAIPCVESCKSHSSDVEDAFFGLVEIYQNGT